MNLSSRLELSTFILEDLNKDSGSFFIQNWEILFFFFILKIKIEGGDILKTIQEHLKEFDRESLVNAYCYKYAPSLNNPYLEDRKVSEIRERLKEKINESIEYLCSVKTTEKDGPCFLLAYHILNPMDLIENILFTMIPYSEMKKDILSGYSFILSSTEEIMGYYVSDAYTTQYHLEDLLIWFLYEATFFGYQRENVEEEAEELERRHQEIEDGTAELIPAEQVFKECGMGTEWVPEERNKEEKEEEHKLMKVVFDFNHKCMIREMMETKKLFDKSLHGG